MVHGVRLCDGRAEWYRNRWVRSRAVAESLGFVPAGPDAAEDDGYVMAFVHNPDRGAADLVILAPQDFTGEPVARVRLPARVPLGFHGNWIADESISFQLSCVSSTGS